jgi:HK97 family phage portal protein
MRFSLSLSTNKVIKTKAEKSLQGVPGSSWWGIIREAFPGAWQRNIEIKHDTVLANTSVFACITTIASDIAKLNWKLTKRNAQGFWEPYANAAYTPVLTKPNRFQNRIQFLEQWMISKLSRGNTYVLKERDNRNVVVAQYILDPTRVFPMVADDGSVFYQLSTDNLAGIGTQTVLVPASEIIHDRWNCLFHPLMGLSPIFACGLPAIQALNILKNYTRFFDNAAIPGGILTAPGSITNDTATRLREDWRKNFSGHNVGNVAVLGDGLKFEQMVMTAVDAQVIDQLRYSDEKVCSAFHMPAYKIGVGSAPTYSNYGAMQQDYYNTCLQIHIESIELAMDEGLSLSDDIGIELDLDGLLRMDPLSTMQVQGEGIKNSLVAPNEGRKKLGLKPVPGGDAPMAQQQNYSLEALAKRDASDNPFVITTPTRVPDPATETTPALPAPSSPETDQAAKDIADWNKRAFEALLLELTHDDAH